MTSLILAFCYVIMFVDFLCTVFIGYLVVSREVNKDR